MEGLKEDRKRGKDEEETEGNEEGNTKEEIVYKCSVSNLLSNGVKMT